MQVLFGIVGVGIHTEYSNGGPLGKGMGTRPTTVLRDGRKS